MSRRSPRSINALIATAAVVSLTGCSALSPYSSVTKLDLKLTASDRLNPDIHGRSSPIVVRLLELKHPVAFESADFFSLYERARQSLTPDLVTSEELQLRPGETVELKLSVQEGSRFVGVLAAYRDLPETRWRYTVPLELTGITHADLKLDQSGIGSSHEAALKAGD